MPADRPRARIVLKEEASDPNHGCVPEERLTAKLLNLGVVNLDKPSGPTSHEVVSWVKKVLHLEKAGHSGTLDPRVTGVLPCGLGRATRVLQSLLEAGKEYVCVLRVHKEQSEERVKEALSLFVGDIFQRPPVKSSVARRVRVRRVYYAEPLEYDANHGRLLFRVGCQAGTYVRKLCVDVGEVLGVGAHMEELRRTRVGPFKEDETLATLQNLADAWYYYTMEGDDRLLRKYVLPVERAVAHVPKVVVRDSAIDAICHGADLAAPGILQLDEDVRKGKLVAVTSLKGELVALGTALEDARVVVKRRTGLMVSTQKVIMERGTYPPGWKVRAR